MSASEKAGSFFTVQCFNPNGIAPQSLGLRHHGATLGNLPQRFHQLQRSCVPDVLTIYNCVGKNR
jgi:hypothetical protein